LRICEKLIDFSELNSFLACSDLILLTNSSSSITEIRFNIIFCQSIIIYPWHTLCGMPSDVDQGTFYGNLQSYKYYIRPAAHRLFGDRTTSKSNKHFENVQRLLKILAQKGVCTTWDMSKIRFHNDVSLLRAKEKEYRRLIVGRKSRDKRLPGILDMGLIVKDGKSHKRAPADQYRLSLHGILYCLDVMDLSNNEIDTIVSKYSDTLPKIFGNWEYLKSKLGDDVYKIKILSKGLLLDNLQIDTKSDVPIQEMMYYVQKKYQRNFDNISEEDLADQISYWFYTNLLFERSSNLHKKKKLSGKQKLNDILKEKKDLEKWYNKFLKEVGRYYAKRNLRIRNFSL